MEQYNGDNFGGNVAAATSLHCQPKNESTIFSSFSSFTALCWTASIMPSARYSGSIVDALLLGYVVAASTLYSSCHAQRNYCEELPH